MPSANLETGQLIRLNIPTRDRALWLGPAWAALCGLIASGAIVWRGQSLLFAILTILLADGIWATLWWTLVETSWSEVLARWNSITIDHPARSLPFTRSGSPADRVLRMLNRSIVWLRSEVWPQLGSSILTGLVSIGLGVILSIIIGWQALALSLAAFALIQLALLVRRVRPGAVSILHGLLDVGLAWLLAHAVFTSVTAISFLIAILFSFAYSGVIEVIRHEKSTRRWLIPQLLIIILLAFLQQPLAAFALAAVISAQALLATVLSGPRFARSAHGWLMIAMIIAAIAVRGM
jgi:hypothetical protein